MKGRLFGINLIEVMVATFVVAIGFFPILNFFSYHNINTKRTRARNVGVSMAKNLLDFLIEDTPYRLLTFNQTLPDFDGKNPEANTLAVSDSNNQIFAVMGANPAHPLYKLGLVGEINQDSIKFWTKFLANPIIDSNTAINKGSELVFEVMNFDRNALSWTTTQALNYHVENGAQTYPQKFADAAYPKTRTFDGRRLNPIPNAQGLISPMAKVSIKLRWAYSGKENSLILEAYKANLNLR